MNSRERFLATMRFEAPDTVLMPCLFQSLGAETLKRWQREGLPRDVNPIAHFGFERMELAPVNLGLLPAGELADREDAREWEAGTDRQHAEETMVRSDQVKETYVVRDPAQWIALRRRLNPESPARYPRFWADYVRSHRERDYPLGIAVAGPFSSLREWLGRDALQRAWRENPAWVGEMVAYFGEFAVAAAGRALQDLAPDFAVVRERWAYQAPLVASSSELGDVLAPCYRKLSDALAGAGVKVRLVEAQGAVADLIPLWLKGGLNGLCYVEAAAGLDAGQLRARYGRDLALVGNVDERALASSRRDIAAEVRRAKELMAKGGYIPAPDRPVSAEVEFEDYEFYLDTLRGV